MSDSTVSREKLKSHKKKNKKNITINMRTSNQLIQVNVIWWGDVCVTTPPRPPADEGDV